MVSESPRSTTSFPKNKIKILLLENVHSAAVELLKKEDFQVECLKEALSEEELKVRIKDVHALGIRSKTRVTDEVLKEANRLLCIGCFCIGTDQVDLDAAEKRGIPVFNSPFSNTRSVAELIIAEIILLSRRLGDKSNDMHKGIWDKSAKDCHEIRGKTIGIIGYGHIGSQLSVLAESLGMNVIFYDIISVMPLGNSKRKDTLEEVLTQADFVTMHVPKTDQTKNMITEKQLKMMKKSSYLLNASRGTVVDIPALASALRSGHLAGAAVDVYPTEPEANIKDWQNELQNCPNTILTPHIGGSTEEAQYAIGLEVADKLIKFINSGSTATAVNFPKLDLPVGPKGAHRILNIHKNVPGVLKNINTLLGDINVVGQMLAAKGTIGYLIVDVEKETSHNLRDEMAMLPTSIKTRILY
jgi:D-3-phosphoglycerate dehydrogenase